jgi:hypothetical protein
LLVVEVDEKVRDVLDDSMRKAERVAIRVGFVRFWVDSVL